MALDIREYRPAPFWPLVWQITLGIFFGSMLTALVGGFLGGIMWAAALSAVQPPPPQKQAAASVDHINDLIRDYKALTAELVSEEEKAEAADLVVEAMRSRKGKDGVDEWQDKARKHRAAGAAGKRTGPVK